MLSFFKLSIAKGMDRLGQYLECGQYLSDAQIEAKEALEDIAMDDCELNPKLHNALTSSVRTRLESALKQLGNPKILTPKQYFILNRETMLGQLASVTGYFVILLQFKQSHF